MKLNICQILLIEVIKICQSIHSLKLLVSDAPDNSVTQTVSVTKCSVILMLQHVLMFHNIHSPVTETNGRGVHAGV